MSGRPDPFGGFPVSDTQVTSDLSAQTPPAATVPLKFEAAVLPVSDVDRAKAFYVGLG
jgi:hypothetical protein